MLSRLGPSPLRTVALLMASLALAGLLVTVRFQASGNVLPGWADLLLPFALALLLVTGLRLGWARFDVRRPASTDALRTAQPPSPGLLLSTALLLGLGLRVSLLLLLQPMASSDTASYQQLAAQLVAAHRYGEEGARAYWPPGLPFVLAPGMALGLGTLGLTLLYGAACFVLTASGLWALGSALGRPHAGAWAACLLAVWPGHVLCSTLTEKELLTGGLLPWLLLATWQAGTAVGWTRLRLALCAGLVNGALLLLQPSLQLLLPLAGVLALLLGASWRRVLVVAVGVLLGTALLVTPWALRNQQVLDRPALVSSNGGSVLYRANNELANGVYQPRGAIELKGGGEVQTDAQYKRLAVEWIVDHPLQFARLSLNKMLLFMGDHSYGAFVVFKRGGVELQRHAYLLTRLLCTLPWVALCLLLALEVCRSQRPSGQSVLVWLGLLPLLYLLGIHAVFESGSKYNLPALPTLLLAVQAALSRTSGLGRQC